MEEFFVHYIIVLFIVNGKGRLDEYKAVKQK